MVLKTRKAALIRRNISYAMVNATMGLNAIKSNAAETGNILDTMEKASKEATRACKRTNND